MPRDGTEIGEPVKATRRKRARPTATTTAGTPASAPIVPASNDGDGGEVHCARANHAPTDLAATITDIVELQKQRTFCIKSQSRSDRACEAFIARFLGYRADLPDKERKAIFTRAAAMRKQVEQIFREEEKGGQADLDAHGNIAPTADGEGHRAADSQISRALSVCEPIIINSYVSRRAWDSLRDKAEKRMRQLAQSLPVHQWTDTVAGFGELGLAIIVGEAGNIGTYATKERVWKRLGLAVIEGERQQRRSNAEQAAAHGYNPRRRAEIWTVADSMFKHQWRGEKEDAPAHAVGPYGAIYAARKAHTETRGWTLAHRDNDARRVMAKALIEDLWRVWHGLPALCGRAPQ